jgi:PAS domain S-box-containing protein
MDNEYRILIADDFPADAFLAEIELRRFLKNFRTMLVESERDYIKALDTFVPDLIISDYQMPDFDGLSALKIAQEKTPLTPVIIFTGSMNEDTAVECMRAGAADYVIKEHIKRLGPAVISALEQKQIKRESQRKTELLISNEKMYHLMFVNNPQPMFIYDCETLAFIEVNQAAIELYGYTESEFLKMTIKEIRPAEDIPKLLKMLEVTGEINRNTSFWRHLKKNGDMILVDINSHGIIHNERPARHVLIKDITQQKKAKFLL